MDWSILPISEFGAHLDVWRRLNASSGDTPLLSPGFIEPLFAEFAAGDEILAIYGAADAHRAMGVFGQSKRFSWQTFQPMVAPLGMWVGEPGVPLQPMLASLINRLPGLALLAAITQQDPNLVPRPKNGPALKTADYISTPRLAIEGRFDDYWAARSKNLRHTVKRQFNKLEREGTAPRFEFVTDPGEMTRCVADYGRIETAGWKGRADSAVGTDNRLGRFYAAILKGFCERGKGLVYRYWYGDKVVAMDLCVHHKRTLFILKTTYDESERATSPAQLMRFEAMRRFFDDNMFKAIEFYGEVFSWEGNWTDDARTTYHLNYYRWPLLARIHRLIRSGRKWRSETALNNTP